MRNFALYNWSDIYAAQLQDGQGYHSLNPVISIWILAENLFRDTDIAHHCFQLADLSQQKVFNDHCSIHVLELNKWQTDSTFSMEDRWMLFFREAKYWSELPDSFNTPEMRQAMATLERFSEKEKAYHMYQARQNAIREQKTQEALLENALKGEEAERKAKEVERKAKDDAIKEQERLREMLKKAGVDPNS